jgi:hypothetical protein
MLGCGYAPQSVVAAFETMASEYGEAHCHYDEKKSD